MDVKRFSTSARRVIEMEGKAIMGLLNQLDATFEQACKLLFECQGRIVVIGIGKSGHIGHKIAATLASTGSPAFFIHAAEANHGDLGMIHPKDLVLGISHSGETDELISILPRLKLLKIPFILITGNPHSALAREATISLTTAINEEACPLGLAPTSSSTAALVMGDAIAISLLNARNFTHNDFANVHPSGRLGRRLLLKVTDIMHKGSAIPSVKTGTPLVQALLEISKKRLGMTTILDEENHLLGIFTDGDLRRAIDQKTNLQTTPIDVVMTRDYKAIRDSLLAIEALHLMEENKITALAVTDKEKNLIGIIHIHDILSKGIK